MRWGLTVVMALLSYPATAQVPAATLGGMKILPAGAPVRGVAGAPGSTDVYAFVTMPGEAHTFTLRSTSAKPIELLFIDAAGNIVLTKSGTREVNLEAVASWADAYAVAVVRADPSVPYILQRSTVAASLEQLAISHMTGYTVINKAGTASERRCWVVPGRTSRSTTPKYTSESQALPGSVFKRWKPNDGQEAFASVITFAVVGDKIEAVERDAVAVRKRQIDMTPERLGQIAGPKFSGYLC